MTVEEKLESLAQDLMPISADPYGAKIYGKQTDEGLNVFLIEPGDDDRSRLVGTIRTVDNEMILYKKEKEQNKHRNTFSWTILKSLVPYVEKVVYETDFATYTAEAYNIERNSFYMNYKSNNKGYMEKIILMVKLMIKR